MADSLGTHQHTQFTTLLAALTNIDQRLSRIEAYLRPPAGNGAPSLVPALSSVSAQPPGAPNPSTSTTTTVNALNPSTTTNTARTTSTAKTTNTTNAATDPINTTTTTTSTSPATTVGTVTYRSLEPPPEGYTITSRSNMQDELDQWTIPRGYSMRIAGAKVSGKRKVRWVCFRGGEARHHRAPVDESVIIQAKAEGRRKPTTDRTSKKCGCLFKFEVIETAKGSDMWVLHYPNEEHKVHNHGPSDQTSDPRARKLPSFMLAKVDQWLREGWLVSKIQEELRSRNFNNVLNTDLYNRKRLLRKEDTQMQE